MRLISMNKAKNGDILGQSILGVDGCILLREGVALTDNYIKKLKQLGVLYIYIKDNNLDDIEPEDPKFVEVKSQAVKSLSNVMAKLQYSNTLEIKNTIAAIKEIIEYLIENKGINSTYLLELKTFDNYTYVHSLNTSVLALFYGVQLSFSKPMLMDLGLGALLHDIGKTKIPVDILNKKGRLTDEEFAIMKKHSEYGYELIKDMAGVNQRVKDIILEHHERIDGGGYPRGLKGEKISKYARIVCISDVYDAIISDRVYRKGFPANEAYEFILGGSGTYFDFELVNIFKNNFSIYPLGSCVKLSNNFEGFVVKHNKGFPDKPVVRIIYDDKGNVITPVEVNLVEKLDIRIETIII
ncbi:HD family phosphohydrolase [Fervidicella metallireducens AeB]|uniref:HD family phosphohydrolase n=1 Tax=Fervidicella metallireducens AeB TaxID=1403537 RepID=A0A017RW39_9CLOT|nr:HD-GYP domain-containing protein [Fervidicella metallireducens]EYE88983.1 HD family phosphohydrolase [Fervidicella metallireducens AeB]